MTEELKQNRAKPKRWTFTERTLARLKAPRVGQKVHWDGGTKGQLGLSLLVSAGGTKTYRATFQLHGKFVSDKIGGSAMIGQSPEVTAAYRKAAADGWTREHQKSDRVVYEDVVDQFIQGYAKPRQRTWDQTRRTLMNTCKPFVNRRFAAITKQDAYELLDSFKASGHDYKAAVTLRWLKTLWKSAARDFVDKNVMDQVHIDWEKRERDRVYSAEEIKATWQAAEQLDPQQQGYIKLLILLAPRKTALASLQRGHLDNPDNPTYG